MPRVISVALETEFARPITSVGYLIQWNMSQILRWSNIGQVSYQPVGEPQAYPWVPVDFEVQGLSFKADADPSCSLSISNLDGSVAALFQIEAMQDVVLDIYQFSRNALASGDAPKLARMVVDRFTMGAEKVEVQLIARGSLYSFSPRRRIDPANGFNYAISPGIQLYWGNEIYLLQEEQNN